MKQILTLLLFFAFLTIVLQAQSPFIYKVFDYQPAPGQFVNQIPKYEEDDTKEDMLRKVEESIAGETKRLISLGGFGGFVVFGFDHAVENRKGKYDFKILGNSFYTSASSDNSGRQSGDAEPGIVMVAKDINNNGLPDDAWYELAGSEYKQPQTNKYYHITYYKPDENKVKTPHPVHPTLNDTSYIKWKDNQSDSGYIPRVIFHQQPYFPQWIETDTLDFYGMKLADNYIDVNGNGTYYIQYVYDWGYADNQPNLDDKSNLDIGWAVNDAGNPVELDVIHFVKVYTGINELCGWLGEGSTEIMGAEDLHLQGIDIDVPVQSDINDSVVPYNIHYDNNGLHLINFADYTCSIVRIDGVILETFEVYSENYTRNINIPTGAYILKVHKKNINKIFKFIVH